MVFGGRPNAGLGHLTHYLRGSTHQYFVDKPYVQSLDQHRQTIVLTGCSIRTFSLLWEIRSMFMKNCFNVSALQHGCRAKSSIAKTNLKIDIIYQWTGTEITVRWEWGVAGCSGRRKWKKRERWCV